MVDAGADADDVEVVTVAVPVALDDVVVLDADCEMTDTEAPLVS